jgi:colanic acid/amylovoran biosynthesis glycosyltransferase
MKILFCTNVFAVVENGPVKFANLLLQINNLYPEHELRILTEDIPASTRFVHRVALSTFWKATPLSQFIRMWAYHQEALRLRKEFPFDVLVYNNALVGMWSAMRFPQSVGMINDYKNVSREKDYYQTGRRSVKENILRYIEKHSARYYNKIITNSDYLTDVIVKNYPQSVGKVFRLYKGIEIPPAPVAYPARVEEPIRILFVKTDFELGGLLVLSEAIGLLSAPVILTVIGPREVHRQRLEALARSIPNLTLRYKGYQPQDRVTEELRHSHVFCVPSYKEALGVANLEAMAHGIPVVSTAVGGIPEVLQGNRCGWLVPPGDAPALAHALRECIDRPDLREQKLKSARLRAAQFDTHSMFRNFIEILSS